MKRLAGFSLALCALLSILAPGIQPLAAEQAMQDRQRPSRTFTTFI